MMKINHEYENKMHNREYERHDLEYEKHMCNSEYGREAFEYERQPMKIKLEDKN